MNKIDRKRALKKLRNAARAVLSNRYGVSRIYTDRLDSLCRSIQQVSSEQRFQHMRGYDLVRSFIDKHSLRAIKVDPASNEFLSSLEWRRLRMKVLRERGARCECCGAMPRHGIRINVDHIKPRKLFPRLALEESNLQILCEDCNHGKGNIDQTDWRGS